MQRLRFALFGNIYQAKKSVSIEKLLRLLEAHQAEIYIDKSFYEYLTQGMGLSVHPSGIIEGTEFDADVAISMGGDGTFLQTASRVGAKQIPIIGMNTGRMGFLADASKDDIEQTIEHIYTGKYTVERRSVIALSYSEGHPIGHPFALNEVAVLKRDNSSMISIRVDVNHEYLTTYQADGLIVNTPTGSTGYALSVGGPVMTPQGGMFGLTAVAPHSLNVRPIVLPDNVTITLTVESRNHQFLVAVDGRSEACEQGTKLILQRAPYDINVLKRPETSFFRTLRDKLMWGNDVRVDGVKE